MIKKALLAVGVTALALVAPCSANAAERQISSSAQYHGRTIDLARSWEGATACWISNTGNRCFDSEREMDQAMERAAATAVVVSPLATCSSALRLYDNTSFGGTNVAITTRSTTINLAGLGFADRTESYRVGACAAALYNGASLYPGSTGTGASAASMLSGWSNVIDKVYLA